jgi:hypothetical protein
MKLSEFELDKIKARIAKAERRIKAGYVPKTKESEQDRVVRLTALLANREAR